MFLQKVVAVALRKLQMGCMPDVNEQLSSFSGMPTTYRKSVLAPLDRIKGLSLQWILMPKLDSHGCIKVCDLLFPSGSASAIMALTAFTLYVESPPNEPTLGH